MAKHVLAGFEGMDEVIVRLLSIGRPVDSPKLTDTDIVAPGGVSAGHRRPIHDIVGQSLGIRLPWCNVLVSGQTPVF